MSWAPIDGPSPPLARSTHWRPHWPNRSTIDGETRTGVPGARRGRSSVVPRRAHHWPGSAPATPARASRARVVTAEPRSAGSGSRRVRRSSPTRPGRVRGRGTSVKGRASGRGSTTSRYGRGLLVLAADRRDDEPAAGPGDGDVEEPGLVVPHLGPGRPRARVAPGDGVDEVGRPEERAAQPQVGPHPLLHPGDDDEVPLEAGRGGRGEQGHRLARGRPRTEGVARDVLAEQVVEEGRRRRAGQPVDVPPGRLEEAEHGVEVAVGARPGRPSGEGGLAPRPGEAGGAPHRPQDLLDAVAVPQPLDGGGEHAVHASGRVGLAADVLEGGRGEDGLGEEDVARAPAAAVELEPAQRPAQPPQPDGVGAAEGRAEGVDDDVGVEGVGAGPDLEGAGEQGEERPDGDLVTHRQVGDRGVEGHAGRAQRAAQRRRPRPTAHQHRHLRPRDAVEQVRLAEQAGDEGPLLGAGAQQVGAGRAVPPSTPAAAGSGARWVADPTTPMCAATRVAASATGAAQRYPVRSTCGLRVRPAGDEEPRVGAAEGLGRGVGVAEEDQRDARCPG